YIFFTGSTQVGKKIMKRASENLTPLTLELGGKSPAIVTSDTDIKLAAKRITWGKFTNAGQTCVAPDYVYVEAKSKNKLLKEIINLFILDYFYEKNKLKNKLIKEIIIQTKKLYQNKPLDNENYVKIINSSHFNRLLNLINQTDEDNIIYGGKSDESTLK